MEKLEADFLREHVAQVRPKDRAEPSLIARWARLEIVPPSDMVDDAVLAVAGDDRPTLVRAEQAACLSGIGRAIYDALLERIGVEHDGRKDPARHRLHLDGMVRDYGGRAVELDLAGQIGRAHV